MCFELSIVYSNWTFYSYIHFSRTVPGNQHRPVRVHRLAGGTSRCPGGAPHTEHDALPTWPGYPGTAWSPHICRSTAGMQGLNQMDWYFRYYIIPAYQSFDLVICCWNSQILPPDNVWLMYMCTEIYCSEKSINVSINNHCKIQYHSNSIVLNLSISGPQNTWT